MYLWLKILHIAAMSLWFVGLFFLPRVFEAHRREPDTPDAQRHYNRLANAVYFRVMTPAGLLAVTLGLALIAYGPFSAWLVLKLGIVSLAVLLHLYLGVLLHRIGQGSQRRGGKLHRALAWLPLLLLLALAALTAAKPATVATLPPPPTAND